MNNSYLAILLMRNLHVNLKVLNLDIFVKYAVHLLLDDLCLGIFSELLFIFSVLRQFITPIASLKLTNSYFDILHRGKLLLETSKLFH